MTPAPCRLFAASEGRLAALDDLPKSLWLSGLTHSQGWVEPRLAGVDALHRALVAGTLPEAATLTWPGGRLGEQLAATLAVLGLAPYCRERGELADTLVQSILFHLDFIVDYRDRGADEAGAVAMALAALAADWQDRRGELDELTEVFGDFGDAPKNDRWDMLRGLLRSEAWQEVRRIRRRLEALPELGRLIRSLGRHRDSALADPASRQTARVLQAATARSTRSRSVRIPELPGETESIYRAGRVARMLPAEAMLLCHPRLRLVWHARHAERTLLCYQDNDRLQETRPAQDPALRPVAVPQPGKRREMGPMLICVDTSGSMRGGAEAVAKAVVLEAVRAAHAQRRPCHVFAFGGPEEIVDLELGVDPAGIERLARFLGQSFQGGTDICGPLERTLERLQTDRWQRADLLIASDGEFGATPELAARVRRAKAEQGLRIQSVLIGDRETIGLLEIADDIFWVRDWRRFGASDSGSPVHSKSLTALYFPGALRSEANLAGTVSGRDASREVLAGQPPTSAGRRP